MLACQAEHGLATDGIAGPLTLGALFPEMMEESTQAGQQTEHPAQIGDKAASAIHAALDTAGSIRKGLVLDALQFASDPERPGEFPASLYIRGGNLYNEDLTPNVITLARIAAGARRQPEYYDGGRRK